MTEYRGIAPDALASSPLPKDDDLFLIAVDGRWSVYTGIGDSHALAVAKAQGVAELGWLRVYRVAVVTLEEFEVQREVVRESLVPKGAAVDS